MIFKTYQVVSRCSGYLAGYIKKTTHHNTTLIFQERLKIAREFGDRSAERRAHSNLGNANIFLGEFETAAEHYKQTLLLAQVRSWLLVAKLM